MSDYLAYTSGVVRLFDTLEAANEWLAEVGGGKVFVAADQLAERTLQHRVQLDNAVSLTARLAAAEEAARWLFHEHDYNTPNSEIFARWPWLAAEVNGGGA